MFLFISELNDDWLVNRVLNGDKMSFDLLVLRYQQRVTAVVGRYNLSNEEIKDITQETFIKAYRSIDKFRGDSKFYTWLYRIGFNLAITKINSSRENQIDEIFESNLTASENIEKDLEGKELADLVKKLLDQVPEEQRTAYVLCEVDSKNYEEIAIITGVPVGTVRSRIFRARKYLMENLQEQL